MCAALSHQSRGSGVSAVLASLESMKDEFCTFHEAFLLAVEMTRSPVVRLYLQNDLNRGTTVFCHMRLSSLPHSHLIFFGATIPRSPVMVRWVSSKSMMSNRRRT